MSAPKVAKIFLFLFIYEDQLLNYLRGAIYPLGEGVKFRIKIRPTDFVHAANYSNEEFSC